MMVRIARCEKTNITTIRFAFELGDGVLAEGRMVGEGVSGDHLQKLQRLLGEVADLLNRAREAEANTPRRG